MPKTAERSSLPICQEGKCTSPARVDCKTWNGPWGYFCLTHWPQVAASPGRLGTGIGHYLFKPGEKIPDWVEGPITT